MLIEEHLIGTIYIPINKGSDDNPNFEVMEYHFTEDDIIHGSCSITSRCCDDQTFSIGGVRPAELALKLRLELPDANAYTLYGAKIRLYSAYHAAPVPDDKWILRGEFWVTSVKRTKTVYSLRASDAIIWLDSGSYVTSHAAESNEEDNPIYKICSGAIYPLDSLVNTVLNYVNDQLKENDIDELQKDIRYDITNNMASERGYVLLPVSVSGAAGSRSPRDYAAMLAQLAAGCLQVTVTPDAPDKAKIFITPYGYKPTYGLEEFKRSWTNTVKIGYEEIELDSCDIADYELYIHMSYVKTYDGIGWSSGGVARKYSGNIVIDLTNNSFLDGRRYHLKDELQNDTVFSVLNNIGAQLGSIKKRPFSLKCHHAFKSLEEMPKLGQRIKIEEKPGVWKESFITKMIWRFRGGWEFGSAGSDSRVLSQASKRSLASHAEDNAKTYANIVLNKAGEQAQGAWDYADNAMNQANAAMDNGNIRVTWDQYNVDIPDIYARLSALESR